MDTQLSAFRKNWSKVSLLFGLLVIPVSSFAETPEHYAHRFAKFQFEFHADVQDPAVFLKTKKGDCDDFATVADDALTREGYTTHLIAIRMPGETHVVLYVDEVHGYLDYNYRNAKHPVLESDSSLEHVASKVADSFQLPWVAVYEFNYHHKMKHMVSNIVRNDKMDQLAHVPMQMAAGGSRR
jgi:hypothetical protein